MKKEHNKENNKELNKENNKERMVTALCISPTGNTKKALRALARGVADKISGGDYFFIDITGEDARRGVYEFGEGDIVLLGCPTYAGRVPNKLMPYLKESVFGDGALGISLVTYGNRAYDDSLKELAYIMKDNDFDLIAALAVPSEHAFAHTLATGRPDEGDLNRLRQIGEKIGEAVLSGETKILNPASVKGRMPEDMKYYVPKKENGEPASFLKAMPVTDIEKCTGCGACIEVCPMGCFNNSITEAEGICIKCQACIKSCLSNAKSFVDEEFLSHKKFLEINYQKAEHDIDIYMA